MFINVLKILELKSSKYISGKGVRMGGDIILSALEEKSKLQVSRLPSSKTLFFRGVFTQLKYFAGRQIRNVATPTGNIATASPISDLNPVYVLANTTLEILDPETGEREIMNMVLFDTPFFVGIDQPC